MQSIQRAYLRGIVRYRIGAGLPPQVPKKQKGYQRSINGRITHTIDKY